MEWSWTPLLFFAALLIIAVLVSMRFRRRKPAEPNSHQLEIIDEQVGDGPEASKGDRVKVHYTGWLRHNGKKFDSSVDRDEPFLFTLGARGVIAGWEEGVQGMRPGGKRKLIIPPSLGYGDRGAPPTIPPGATLEFDIELLEIR